MVGRIHFEVILGHAGWAERRGERGRENRSVLYHYTCLQSTKQKRTSSLRRSTKKDQLSASFLHHRTLTQDKSRLTKFKGLSLKCLHPALTLCVVEDRLRPIATWSWILTAGFASPDPDVAAASAKALLLTLSEAVAANATAGARTPSTGATLPSAPAPAAARSRISFSFSRSSRSRYSRRMSSSARPRKLGASSSSSASFSCWPVAPATFVNSARTSASVRRPPSSSLSSPLSVRHRRTREWRK